MPKIDPNKPLPQIHSREIVAQSKLFRVERLDLEFSNGATREFERMAGGNRGAVMIVPMLDENTMVLIREYAAGTHSYQLGFPKGLIPYVFAAFKIGSESSTNKVRWTSNFNRACNLSHSS